MVGMAHSNIPIDHGPLSLRLMLGEVSYNTTLHPTLKVFWTLDFALSSHGVKPYY
jgi:hypothetical protein